MRIKETIQDEIYIEIKNSINKRTNPNEILLFMQKNTLFNSFQNLIEKFISDQISNYFSLNNFSKSDNEMKFQTKLNIEKIHIKENFKLIIDLLCIYYKFKFIKS